MDSDHKDHASRTQNDILNGSYYLIKLQNLLKRLLSDEYLIPINYKNSKKYRVTATLKYNVFC